MQCTGCNLFPKGTWRSSASITTDWGMPVAVKFCSIETKQIFSHASWDLGQLQRILNKYGIVRYFIGLSYYNCFYYCRSKSLCFFFFKRVKWSHSFYFSLPTYRRIIQKKRIRLFSELPSKNMRDKFLLAVKKIPIEHNCKEFHSKNDYAWEEAA